MQQIIAVIDASGGNDHINSFANGNTQPAQHPKISFCLNSDILTTQVDNG
jgi:hypothetical protein